LGSVVHPWFMVGSVVQPWFMVGSVVHPWFIVGSVLHIVLGFFVVFYFASFVFVLCLVYPMLSVSLDCPFLIASSFFSNVYLTRHFFFIEVESERSCICVGGIYFASLCDISIEFWKCAHNVVFLFLIV